MLTLASPASATRWKWEAIFSMSTLWIQTKSSRWQSVGQCTPLPWRQLRCRVALRNTKAAAQWYRGIRSGPTAVRPSFWATVIIQFDEARPEVKKYAYLI